MKILFLLLLIFTFVQTPAQILKKVTDKVVGKAKGEINDAKYTAKQKAREAAYKELDEVKAAFDSTDIDYAILISDNAGLFAGRSKGEFGAKFLRLTSIANSFYKDADLSDEENARLNLQLGQSGYATGRYVYAEKRLDAAKRYFEKAYLTNDLGYLKTISSQGLLYTSMGRFLQAEKLTNQALQLRQEKLGTNNMGVAASYNNYAVLHYDLAQFNEAEKEFEDAKAIIKSNKMEGEMPFAILLNNEAILFQSMGRLPEAVKNLEAALAIAEKLESSNAKNHLKFYSNLALLYQQMAKYPEAEKIYQQLEKKLEKGKPEYANMLNNMAVLAMLMKREDRVEDMLKQSAGIYKSAMGDNSPAYAKVIGDLGNFYRYKQNYTAAEPLLKRVLQIRELTLGVDHPLYAQSQEDMAILYWKKKDFSDAYTFYKAAMEKSLDFINKYFPPMSEAEKTKYWDMLSSRFLRFYNFAVDAAFTNENVLKDMYEYRVSTKGLLISSSRKISAGILASGDEQLVKNYSAWIDMKEQLATLYGYSKEELKEQSVNMDSLESAANTLEKNLSIQSKDFAHFYFTSKIKYSDIRSALKEDEAAVEIIRLQNFDQVFTDESRYLLLIADKNNGNPQLVIINNGNDLEGKYAKNYRVSMKNKVADEKSYDYYWAPAAAALKNKKKIYFSLDGVYTQINLYTLKKPGGDFLIKETDIVLLGNTKDLITHKQNENKVAVKNATLIGFPDYGSTKIPELPASKTEVEGINKVLKSSGYQVAELIQKNATEANLKAAQKISILHIATHGYFLKDVEKTSWPLGVHADYAKDNVLLRSGLMLSGASEADQHSGSLDNRSNGIITSYEAMNLNLKGTSLVVLSACETGLGEVKAGEGVYGLQRAFLVAGAEALIMSLWKVDDKATQELMNSFYSSWIKGGNKQKAFKQAQLQLMAKYKEPYYWGAFVMMEE